jgi:hypothetical protein
MKCRRCHRWHVLHQAGTAGPYDRAMLYLTCGDGGVYYAGNAGNPTDREVRSPPVAAGRAHVTAVGRTSE